MTTSLALVAIIGFSVRSIVRARRHLRLALELDGDASCGDWCPCGAYTPVDEPDCCVDARDADPWQDWTWHNHYGEDAS